MQVQPLPSIEPGTRTIFSGRTGCGKTTLAKWGMRDRSSQHWFIINPKHTTGYKDLPDSIVLTKWDAKKFARAIEDHRFVIWNCGRGETTADFLDAVLMWIHEHYQNIGICIDEATYFHSAGQAGEGLIAVLTRGRERNQTLLILTQRPKWLSLYCFTESDNIVAMQLKLEDDRKRLVEATGEEIFMETLAKRYFRWYYVDDDYSVLWSPLPHP